MRFTPELQLHRQLSYTKFMVAVLPDVLPNVHNSAQEKRKLNSILRYGPGQISVLNLVF